MLPLFLTITFAYIDISESPFHSPTDKTPDYIPLTSHPFSGLNSSILIDVLFGQLILSLGVIMMTIIWEYNKYQTF